MSPWYYVYYAIAVIISHRVAKDIIPNGMNLLWYFLLPFFHAIVWHYKCFSPLPRPIQTWPAIISSGPGTHRSLAHYGRSSLEYNHLAMIITHSRNRQDSSHIPFFSWFSTIAGWTTSTTGCGQNPKGIHFVKEVCSCGHNELVARWQ